MQKLIIFAALVACSLAAPIDTIKEDVSAGHLSRPSPINPDILSDPKPAEKVTLITDPKEQTLYQPKAISIPEKIPGPFAPVNPIERLARSKRETKISDKSEEDSSEEDKKSSPPLKIPSDNGSPLATLLSNENTKPSPPTPIPSTTELVNSGLSTSSERTAPRRPYSPLIHQHNEHLFKPTTDADTSASSTSTTTAVPSSGTFKDHLNEKRDIPVPQSRSHQHDDDETEKNEEPATAKASKEEVNNGEQKDEDRKAKTTAHPVTISRPIPVAELFAKKPPTE